MFWCKKFDIPYFEKHWIHLLQVALTKGQDVNYVFGKYLNKMKLKNFKHLNFEDSFTDVYQLNTDFNENVRYKIDIVKEVIEDDTK